jgi:hypothetical protein
MVLISRALLIKSDGYPPTTLLPPECVQPPYPAVAVSPVAVTTTRPFPFAFAFPREPDKELVDLIQKLVVVNAANRLGAGRRDAEEIKQHPWFYGVDWQAMMALRVQPPFVPQRVRVL